MKRQMTLAVVAAAVQLTAFGAIRAVTPKAWNGKPEIVKFADGKKVIWVDFNDRFLDEKGDVLWCMPDRLHPNAAAYRDIWAPAVLPHFKKICGK